MADQNRGRDGANAAGDRRDGADDRLDLGEDGVAGDGALAALGVDLQKYLKSDAQAKILYPKELSIKYQLCNRKLTVRLDATYSARLFELFSADLGDKQ